MLLGQGAPQIEDRRQVDKPAEMIDRALARRMAGTWAAKGTPRLDGREGHRLRSPRTLESPKQILQRHTIESDVMRTDPEVDHTLLIRGARHTGQVAEAERPA